MLKIIERREKDNVITKGELVSRKVFIKICRQSRVKRRAPVYKNTKNLILLKKLPQKWRWRWNRKSNNIWKQVRFLKRFDVNGLQVFRVSKNFRFKKIGDNWLMWRYQFIKNNLRFKSPRLTILRLDGVLVSMGAARSIFEARLKLQSGLVIVNGVVNFDFNAMLLPNDVVQVRDHRGDCFVPLSRRLSNTISIRGLGYILEGR